MAMVRQFREALNGDYPDDLKNGLRRVLELFDEAAARHREQAPTSDQHHVQVFAWPFHDRGSDTYSFAVRFLRLRCHRDFAKAKIMREKPCSAVGLRRKDKRLKDLRASANAPDPAGSAARAALAALRRKRLMRKGRKHGA